MATGYGALPLAFEPNLGQANATTRFLARGQGYSLSLTDSGATLSLARLSSSCAAKDRLAAKDGDCALATDVIQMRLEGRNAEITSPAGEDELAGKVNYFIGNDPTRWHANLPTYGRVRYASVYPGIDLVYYGRQERLEYDFVVAPGASPQLIRLFFGSAQLSLTRRGELLVSSGKSSLVFAKPTIYQSIDGRKISVPGNFALANKNSVHFVIGHYDRTRPLVIDPTLTYSTYLGGTTSDSIQSIAVNKSGEAYVTGLTASVDFPVTAGALQTAHLKNSSNTTAFVAKLNAWGTALVYSTYIGGSGNNRNGDAAYGIAVDLAGAAYIAGSTYSSDFPVTPSVLQTKYQGAKNGTSNAFVAKLNSSGSALVYSTYLGGSGAALVAGMGAAGDAAAAIAVDSSGNAYLAGSTGSTNFPVTKGVIQATKAGGENDKTNAFAAKISSTGTALIYSTYLGGTDEDLANALAIDAKGNLFLAGRTVSSDFPITKSAFQAANKAGEGGNGIGNAFIAKLNPNASALTYSTYLGGTFGDMATGIAIDSAGSAYVTGQASSLNFPVTPGAFQQANKGSSKGNAFISKLNPAGTALTYSTYVGGNGGDAATGLAIDGVRSAYITGYTSSKNFPVTADAYQPTIKVSPPGITGFLTEINSTGTAEIYSTYFGGSQWDNPNALVFADGAAYLAGLTMSSDLPITKGAFESVFVSGDSTGFVSKLSLGAAPTGAATLTTLTSSANPQTPGNTVNFTATVAPVSGAGVPTGVVTFSVGEATTAEMGLDSSGNATYPASNLALGDHYVQASYGGSAAYSASGNGLTQSISLPVAAAPTFTPPAGTYASAQSVKITDTTIGATIYYTTNGTAPTSASQPYSSPVAVSAGTTIKAMAEVGGYDNSPVSSASYRITPASKTTLSITSAGGPVSSVNAGSVVALTASVSIGGAAVTTGQVSFCDASAKSCTDVHRVGSSQLTANGTAVFQFTPAAGVHSYKAVFPGTNSAAASASSSSPLTVKTTGPSATSISFAASGTAGNFTLSATVTGFVTPASVASPAGTVSFIDTGNAGAPLARASLGSGVAGLNWTPSRVATPGGTSFLAIGDFNGDGVPDVAAIINSSSIAVLLGNGNGTFTAQSAKPSTGEYPAAIATGDFNGDGKIDLAVLDAGNGISNGSVTILLGNGNGTFIASPHTPSAGVQPGSLTIADFNGDGIPDLAITDYGTLDGSGNLTILLGHGDGTFTAAPPSPAIGGASSGLIAADLNGDGVPDLAFLVPQESSGLVQVMLGNGDGTFAEPLSVTTDLGPTSIAVGDFNGDGKLDMAVATGPGLDILLGNGNGTFTTEFSGLDQGTALALGDFNGDGKADLALSNFGSMTILLGNGDGTFTAVAATPQTGTSAQPLLADFNGDGLPDIAIANGAADTITLLLTELTQTATATAANVQIVGPSAHLIKASYTGDSNYAPSASAALVLPPRAAAPSFSVAAGTYYSPQTVTISSPSPGATIYYTLHGTTPTPASAVYNGPIVVAETETLEAIAAGGAYSVSPVASAAYVLHAAAATTTTLVVAAGAIPVKTVVQGSVVTLTATVKSGTAALTPGLVNFCIAAAKSCTDIHLLGSAQLSSKGTAQLKFIPGAGAHSYKAEYVGENSHLASASAAQSLTVTPKALGKIPTATTITSSGTAGNFKLTGTVTAKGSTTSLAGVLSFLDATKANALLAKTTLGTGTKSIDFVKEADAAVGVNPVQIATGDFNGDGIPDLAVSNYQSFNVTILLGNGNGTFAPAASLSTTGAPSAIQVADFNGDGKPDLAVSTSANSNKYGSVQIFLGNGNGTFKPLAARTLGGPFVVGDFNRDGLPDLAFADQTGDSITVLPGKGTGTFGAGINTTVASPYYLAEGDFNGDGKLDLAVLSASAANTVTILLGSGNGAFTAAAKTAPTGRGPNAIAVADFNGDGKLDMAVVNSSVGTVSVLLGSGNGTFTALAPDLAAGNGANWIRPGDFNGDGNPDLAVTSFNSKRVSVFLGTGAGKFASPIELTPSADPQSLAVADFNGDGLSDIGVVVFSSHIDVLVSQPVITATASVAKIAPKGAGTHQVKASYAGNTNYAASASVTKPLTGAEKGEPQPASP